MVVMRWSRCLSVKMLAAGLNPTFFRAGTGGASSSGAQNVIKNIAEDQINGKERHRLLRNRWLLIRRKIELKEKEVLHLKEICWWSWSSIEGHEAMWNRDGSEWGTTVTSMSLMSWNCKGLGSPQTVHILKELFPEHFQISCFSWKQKIPIITCWSCWNSILTKWLRQNFR